MRLLCVLFAMLLGSICSPFQQAQWKSTSARIEALDYQTRGPRGEIIDRAEKYKRSLNRLLLLIENDIKRTERTLERSKALYQQGLAGKSELEELEKRLDQSRSRLEEMRQSVTEADSVMSEIRNLAPPDKPPYEKSILLQVLELDALTMREIISKVLQRGVGFRLTLKDEQEFRSAGASIGLINAIRASYKRD